jgi:alkanesulfonate monooxygenase SsuD/methylene tetrahydromethanopterin reductase-like flavin-dependent oxidoreductase (luciferase family)
MIGGSGEKVLLRLVAKHADMWNSSGSAERMEELIGVIRKHGDGVGRDTEQIEKTVMMPLAYHADDERQDFICGLVASMQETTPDRARRSIMIGDKQECLDTIERYTKAGVTHFIFMLFAPYMLDELQAFAEDVIPSVRN